MEIETVETVSDGEIGENCDTSNIKLHTSKTSDHDEGNLSEYEKLRLKNIAERKAKFNELKLKDKLLDLSRNNRKKSDSIYRCDQCPKSYKRKSALKNHLLEHKTVTDPKDAIIKRRRSM